MACNGDCGNCSGCGGGCSGCGRALELTEPELELLQQLGQVAFLPVARKLGEETPVLPEDMGEQTSLVIQCLEKKNLISLDYDRPLKGYHSPEYDGFPLRGSMGLTARGQRVLELAEVQGIIFL